MEFKLMFSLLIVLSKNNHEHELMINLELKIQLNKRLMVLFLLIILHTCKPCGIESANNIGIYDVRLVEIDTVIIII